MTDNVIVSLFLGLGIFGTPGFLMVIWLMWREIRDTRELADYYCRQTEYLADRWQRKIQEDEEVQREAAKDWLADW